MIQAIIFDFGNVFIDLDLEGALRKTKNLIPYDKYSSSLVNINHSYEMGLISTQEFIAAYLDYFPNLTKIEVMNIWNFMLRDFPKYRLEFLKRLKLSNLYQLILLSNTNELHINWIREHVPFYNEFKNCFDSFYLSHEIHLRKPNRDIFEYVLSENNLDPSECFFIDDSMDNINTAQNIGLYTWHIDPHTEDITQMLEKKSSLFEI
ncbi:HAD family hydrolase [Aestuariivivens sediminicola]|uniref:HAD family hydrolase n=1 Tax=Aestuariivivens sediminicola TaxID=2913560 RepID=UPI001F597A25|nr:HAD family phosphatase [Aestuariivivens sediminicola]